MEKTDIVRFLENYDVCDWEYRHIVINEERFMICGSFGVLSNANSLIVTPADDAYLENGTDIGLTVGKNYGSICGAACQYTGKISTCEEVEYLQKKEQIRAGSHKL